MARAPEPTLIILQVQFFPPATELQVELISFFLPDQTTNLTANSQLPNTFNDLTESQVLDRSRANMVDYKKKRKLAAAAPNETAKNNNKRRKPSAPQKKAAAKPKQVVDASSLAWESVDLPAMFNDAEGFFGLEEVKGIEVVRNGNTVKFVSRPLTIPRH